MMRNKCSIMQKTDNPTFCSDTSMFFFSVRDIGYQNGVPFMYNFNYEDFFIDRSSTYYVWNLPNR